MSTAATLDRQQMDVVIVGHVDHGKSTVIGRLMADTGSLPEGKLDQVKAMCAANSRPFEYAFLLDALKNEQAQGITIDAARCFFKTEKRNYIIHDAPGHIEFLKNMVTGAARAEAALLTIDAKEGVRENSKRHGYLVSMLGLKQLCVLVNKMDLVDYSEETFDAIKAEYTEFLGQLGVTPTCFIPVSAMEGVNIARGSEKEMPWYDGMTVLDQVDEFTKLSGNEDKIFRMPVQDIYKFTADNDERRIIAGTISTGTIKPGEDVVFLPSGKESTITSIEGFNTPEKSSAQAGFATGFQMATQIYIKPGELMVKKADLQPHVGRRFRCNMFWMGRPPMVPGKEYKLKIGSSNVPAELITIHQILDASELSTVENKGQVDRHDVAECILETGRPIAYDLRNDVETTGRFVIVDEYEIAGCGIILEAMDDSDEAGSSELGSQQTWETGHVTHNDRAEKNGNQGKLIIVHGEYGCGKRRVAKELERQLFDQGYRTYYFGISNFFEELDHDTRTRDLAREHHIDRLGELARVVTDSGTLLITTVTDADDFDLEKLNRSTPEDVFVINMGENNFNHYKLNVELKYRLDETEAAKEIIEKLKSDGILLR
ncbi:MAG: GTP-binding protein [Candidatus Hydrogenedentota bacterium]